MAALSVGERYDLIRSYIEKARINPAHLAIAQLVQHGYVDRVLTTNFDPLVAKACGLINTPVATYDFAAAQTFNPGDTQPAAVFHLHGQHTGFRLLNTDEECNSLRNAITPLFQDCEKRRIWIVVGYSGDQDPVFEQLAHMDRFDHRLYWVCYNDNEPSYHVRTRLLHPDKYAFYVQGHDADSFFTQLADGLEYYPPSFMTEPFSHLQKLFETIKRHESSFFGADHLAALQMIVKAKQDYETEENRVKFKMEARLWLGDEDELVADLETKRKTADLSKQEREMLAWGYIHQGSKLELNDKTQIKNVIRKNVLALEVQPHMPAAYYNWGIALDALARLSDGKKQRKLFQDACKKYEKAIEFKEDFHQAYNNWGNTLLRLFRVVGEDEQASVLQHAEKVLLKGEELFPSYCSYNLACVAALNKDSDKCKEWIEVCRKKNRLPDLDHIRADKDLKYVRRRKWFKQLCQNLGATAP